MLINIIKIIKFMQIKIISKNKTNKHIFFYFFWTRQGLTLVVRISIHDRKLGLRSSILRILFSDIWYFNFVRILYFLFENLCFFLYIFYILFFLNFVLYFNFQNCFVYIAFKKTAFIIIKLLYVFIFKTAFFCTFLFLKLR